jgi:hypothetical protein
MVQLIRKHRPKLSATKSVLLQNWKCRKNLKLTSYTQASIRSSHAAAVHMAWGSWSVAKEIVFGPMKSCEITFLQHQWTIRKFHSKFWTPKIICENAIEAKPVFLAIETTSLKTL